MKKLTLLSLIALLTVSCASAARDKYKADYQLGFKQVRVNGQPQSTEQMSGLAYKDEWIRVSFVPGRQTLSFTLENLTPQSIKIHWDESAMVINGHPERIIHSGVKYVNASNAIPASIVPGKSVLKDQVLPAASVYYVSGTKYTDPYWHIAEIMPGFYTRSTEAKASEFKALVSRFDGADIYDLMLQLESNGEKREYFFDMHIPSAKVTEIQELVPISEGQ